MIRTILISVFCLLLFSVASAQTVRIQGKEIPYRLVDGKQMISRLELAKVFPDYPEEEGDVDLAELVDNPDARVMRRNGLIVSVRYYNQSMAAIYGPKAAPRSSPGQQTQSTSKAVDSDYRSIMREIVRLSNIEREKHGAPPVQADRLLDKAATGHSEEMAKLDYFSHTSPTAGRETPHERILLAGASVNASAENIAYFTGHAESGLAKKAVVGWMNSPGHRKNLLNPIYTHLGVGVGKRGRTYYLTQNFGRY